MNQTELDRKVKDLAAAKTRLSTNEKLHEQNKGQLQMLEKTMKKEFGVTLKQAPAKLAEMRKSLKKVEELIAEKWEEFNSYGI